MDTFPFQHQANLPGAVEGDVELHHNAFSPNNHYEPSQLPLETSRWSEDSEISNDPFSPSDWAEDGEELYPGSIDDMVKEFNGRIHQQDTLGESFTRPVASDREIRAFLSQANLFNFQKHRWENIPVECTTIRQLLRPLRAIADAVVDYFISSRIFMDSLHIPTHLLECYDPDDGQHRRAPFKRLPHLMTLGLSGPNFGPLQSPVESGPSYTSMISPAEIQIDALRDFQSDFIQLAIYARNCFKCQHNRRFVYALLITESIAQLYFFDRSGACYSRDVNIHAEPVAFLRIILGVWSPYDEVVGFDTGIFWKQGNSEHREWHRYITSLDDECRECTYLLSENTPIYSRRWIVGRGTTIWATFVNERQLLIKEAWPDTFRDREWELLNNAKGLAGIVQVFASENGLSTSALRGLPPKTLADDPDGPPRYVERQFGRVILANYGNRTIDKFSDRLELLYGFRDAIRGHQNLWNSGVLHGDISMENILLLMLSHSTSGGRGVLIDLDMAMWVIGSQASVSRSLHKMGTRTYQSVNLLESQYKPRTNFSRDYLDDLESFYYLLSHICATFTAPCQQLPTTPDFIQQWSECDSATASFSKLSNLLYPSFQPTPYFGAVFERLLERFRAFVAKAVGRKLIETARRERAGLPAPTWGDLRSVAQDDYAAVLLVFEDAISGFESIKPAHVNLPSLPELNAMALVPVGMIRHEDDRKAAENVEDVDERAQQYKLQLHPMSMFY
ncbi:hypothetical protein BDN70DRAFT_870137 [Pholiota conissans]|uniref:Fungal-type protein kinase domain-containing protein n=1 Tax=Pholiota conissans TaxID=109636 RepID=A0A9P5ZE20_9AGAR|nr:hypothetical protein BDN70DRAFT_870137 [Pholiota conissans]